MAVVFGVRACQPRYGAVRSDLTDLKVPREMPRSIRELPGPRGLPLIGNAHRVRTAQFHAIAEGWCERYGPIFRFDLGPRRIVAIADAEEINTVLRERPDGYRRWREIESVAEELAGSVGVFHVEGATGVANGGWSSPL